MNPRRGPVRNADDFRREFQAAIGTYEGKIALRLRELQRTMDPVLEGRAIDAELEAHIRNYVIDPLLAALNWSTDENLTIEALVRSKETRNRRRLDYLGVETETVKPLLVVEAKRPNAPKPEPATHRSYTIAALLAEALTLRKAGPDKALDLKGSWTEWICSLFDYVNSLTGPVPVRVVITNGDWLILFEDSVNAFKGAETVSPDRIKVYESRADILKNANEVFGLLNYDALVPLGRPIEASEILGAIDPQTVTHAMRALRVTYVDIETGLGVVPTIHLVPELLLFRADGGWLRVFANIVFQLPHAPEALPAHLSDVNAAHGDLLNAVAAALGNVPPLVAVEDAYNALWLGTQARSVQRLDGAMYLTVLGSQTHFIIPAAAHSGCPFHSAAGAIAENAYLGFIIAKPSSTHVTHFGDRSPQHCAHRAMRQLREQQIAQHNRRNFPPRGQVEDGAFCKLWVFEHHLCCQKCVFRDVCAQSIGPQMPCIQHE